jgi:putative ABC transport system permease protein
MTTQAINLFRRIIARNPKVYALKIISLALAFASSSLIILFSLNEFGYDRFHENEKHIFRVIKRNTNDEYNGNRYSTQIAANQFDVVNSLSSDSVEVARVTIMNGITLKTTTNLLESKKIHAADPALTRIFTFDITDGVIQKFQKDSNGALVSESLATRLFGSAAIEGKHVALISASGDSIDVKVAAVFKDFPENSHEEFNFFISFDSANVHALGFNPNKTGIYGKLNKCPGSLVEQRLNNASPEFSYSLQPVADIYFGRHVVGEGAMHGDGYSVLILTCITGFIMLLALSNYVILTTLSLPHRAKELAIKKLAGTSQWNLVRVFFTESFVIVLVAFVIGLSVLVIMSGFIKPLLAIDVIALMTNGNLSFIFTCILTLLVITVAPLMLVMKFISASPSGLLGAGTIAFPRLKQVLTVVQLGISMLVLVFSLVMKRQISYSLVKEPGRNNDQIVYLNYPSDLTQEGLVRLREGWKSFHPNILDVLATSHLPHSITSREINSPFYKVAVDPMFTKFFDLNMIKGNWFRPNASDSSFVVNESGLRLAKTNANILGVVEDISGHFNQPQRPVKFHLAQTTKYNYLFIRVLEVDIRRTVNFLSSTFNHAEIHFLNPKFNSWLTYQDRLNAVSNLLAIIGAVLSCCAIYGLSLSLVQEKMKQLAVHKIYGANVFHITFMLLRHFGKEVMLAVLVFAPVTYILVTELLRNFAYATSLQWHDPVIPVVFTIVMIAGLSMVQSLRLNLQSLVSSLKG